MKFGTKVIHGYNMIDKTTGSSSIPIYQASTFHQENVEQGQQYAYSRFGNPTRTALEEAVASLENAKYGYSYASGMAAISAVFLAFNTGDDIVVCKDVYGGAFQLINEVLPRFNIGVTYVDASDLNAWEAAIKPNTKALYIETPSNPLMKITDIEAVVKIAKKHNLITIIDNTFMTPQFQQPLDLGVDIVIHSATKFLNGHSDVVLGLVVTNSDEWNIKLKKQQTILGGMPGPQDCWLTMRGIKTMNLRMKQSAESALKIAKYLQTHPNILSVNYPGLESNPGYEINKKQASSGGAVLSFELKSQKDVFKLFNSVSIPIVAVSLGGVESILSYPVKMSHASVPEKDSLEQGITNGLVRLSVGIEDADDLIEDLKNALDNL